MRRTRQRLHTFQLCRCRPCPPGTRTCTSQQYRCKAPRCSSRECQQHTRRSECTHRPSQCTHFGTRTCLPPSAARPPASRSSCTRYRLALHTRCNSHRTCHTCWRCSRTCQRGSRQCTHRRAETDSQKTRGNLRSRWPALRCTSSRTLRRAGTDDCRRHADRAGRCRHRCCRARKACCYQNRTSRNHWETDPCTSRSLSRNSRSS